VEGPLQSHESGHPGGQGWRCGGISPKTCAAACENTTRSSTDPSFRFGRMRSSPIQVQHLTTSLWLKRRRLPSHRGGGWRCNLFGAPPRWRPIFQTRSRAVASASCGAITEPRIGPAVPTEWELDRALTMAPRRSKGRRVLIERNVGPASPSAFRTSPSGISDFIHMV
jgi:hypothetical protein